MEPTGDRAAHDDPPLGGVGGGRPACGAGLPRGADDLLHAEPAGDRADQQVRLRRAGEEGAGRPRRADRALPGRLHAAAAARDRVAALLGRAARRRRNGRAGAGDRRRRARRSDLRELPRNRCESAPDVGPRGKAQAGARGLRRGGGRPRPVLLPTPRRVPGAPGRGGDPRPPLRADPDAAPARGGLRVPARARRRRDPRGGLAGAGRAAGDGRRAAARPGRALPDPHRRFRRRPDRAAVLIGRQRRRRRRLLGRDARQRRGGTRLLDRSSGRDLSPSRALLRGRRAGRRLAARDRQALRGRLLHAGEEGDRGLRRGDGDAAAGASASSSASARSRSPSR